jgi:hypothetical protein
MPVATLQIAADRCTGRNPDATGFSPRGRCRLGRFVALEEDECCGKQHELEETPAETTDTS